MEEKKAWKWPAITRITQEDYTQKRKAFSTRFLFELKELKKSEINLVSLKESEPQSCSLVFLGT